METRDALTATTPKDDRGRDAVTLIREVLEAFEHLAAAVTPRLGSGNLHTERVFRRFFAALNAALTSGVEVTALLGALSVDPDETAPPPPPPPWAPYLELTPEQLVERGVALEVFVRPWQIMVFFGDPATPPAAAWFAEQVKGSAWAHRELAEAGVPDGEHTVGRLVEVLKARVQGVHQVLEARVEDMRGSPDSAAR